MRPFLNEFITTLSYNQSQRVGFLLEEAKASKSDISNLVTKLSSSGIYANIVLRREDKDIKINSAKIGGGLQDVQRRMQEIYNVSNVVSTVLSSNVSVLTSDIKALEDELVALEKSIENYSFLLSDGGSFNYAFLESFSDDKNRETQFEFLVPDRAGLYFSSSEEAIVHTDEGILSIPTSIERDYPLTGLVLGGNAQTFVTSDTEINSSTNQRVDSGWRMAFSAPGPVTSTHPEFQKLYTDDTLFPGVNVIAEYVLAAPSPCDTINLVPFSDIPFDIVQIVVYEDLEESTSKKLLQEPMILEGVRNFYFQLQSVAKFKLYLRQKTYTRDSLNPLPSEAAARIMADDIYRIQTGEARARRWLARINLDLGIKKKSQNNVAHPKVDFDKLWGSLADLKRGVYNWGFTDHRKRWSNDTQASSIFLDILKTRMNWHDWENLLPALKTQKLDGQAGNFSEANYNLQVLSSSEFYKETSIQSSEANRYEYSLGIQSIQIGSGIKGFKAYYVSKPVPSPGDVGETKLKVAELNYQDTSVTKDQPIVTSVEYSVTNQSKPRREEDWVPILPVGQDRVIAERFLPDNIGKGYLRFLASLQADIVLYKNGYIVDNIDMNDMVIRSENGQTAKGLKLPTGFAMPDDIFVVDYVPAVDPNLVNFEALGYSVPPLVSSYSQDGAGEKFSDSAGQLIVQLLYEPYVDHNKLKTSSYVSNFGHSPYNPVLVALNDGTIATNLTNYSGGTQSILNAGATGVQFIQTGNNIMFNRPITNSFRVFYQYLPSNLRFRVVMRTNSKDFVSPKVDFVQVKAKTRKPDARKSG